jgi:hypothetical protein
LRTKAWLVARSGPLAGTRYLLPEGSTRIGRSVESDVVVHGPNTATVSAQHVEIVRDGGTWRIRDTGSTNGTYLNGERITDAELTGEATIRLGNDGPEFGFVTGEDVPASALDRTLVIPEGIVLPPPAPAKTPEPHGHEGLLSEAVRLARRARMEGLGDQTLTLMRDVLHRALHRSSRRSRRVIYALAAALVLISAFGYWKIGKMKGEKASIDQRIQEIEVRLNESQQSREQTDRLISQLDAYQGEAESLQRSLLYRVGGGAKETFVTKEIRRLMAEFGAEVYSIPPEFVERVNVHIEQFQGPDRPHMERALNQAKAQIATMRRILQEEKLPPDFAYVPLVESGLTAHQSSAAGASGLWQFTPGTARAFGLRVDGAVDERDDLRKSTRAAGAFLRQLLLDFGSGSSVMLALAAYNLGPAKVKQAVMKSVEDPIKQRNFWYLYRARALPAETREFVPKVVAAIIIGRNPERFGF